MTVLRDAVVAQVRERDRQLIEAVRVRLAPPFRPRVRVIVDDLARVRLIIGGSPGGYVAVDLDPAELERARLEGDLDLLAEALLNAGRRALAAVGIDVVEDHITLGAE